MKFRLQPFVGEKKLPDAGVDIAAADRQECPLGLIRGQRLPIA